MRINTVVVGCLVVLVALVVAAPSWGQRCVSDCDCSPGKVCRPFEGGGRCEEGNCTDDYTPVCGLDGKTYSNRCWAELDRVGVAHEGQCEPSGQMCGGIAGFPCPEGQFCDIGSGQCHVADAAGVCRNVPKGCPETIDPVCGCDRKTYDSDCLRQQAGVPLDHLGTCEQGDENRRDGLACGCCWPTVVSEKGVLIWSADPALDKVSRVVVGRYRLIWNASVDGDAFFVQPLAPMDDFPQSLLGWPARISTREIEVATDAHAAGGNGSHTHRQPIDVGFSLLRCPRSTAGW